MEAKHIIFFDDTTWEELLPLTLTRPVVEVRTGIFTLREKWNHFLQADSYAYMTQDYLSGKYALEICPLNFFVNGAVLPNVKLAAEILSLKPGELLRKDDVVIAGLADEQRTHSFLKGESHTLVEKKYTEDIVKLSHVCDIFSFCDTELKSDFEWLTRGRKSENLPASNRQFGKYDVFIEPGARVECSTINTESGPVYIGRDAEVMEGCMIRGPFALGEHSVLKMGAKIYGATSIGPHSKVGGEVNNSVIFGYSNKAHDGFLGNSVLGEWVNLGADTNNSNLKNNYAPVKMWHYTKKSFVQTGLTFAGLIMGDHSKCGINTMFNTGTVIGVSCNLFGDGFHRNYVPSFSWGGAAGYTRFNFNKAIEVAENMMNRRGLSVSEAEKSILSHIFNEE